MAIPEMVQTKDGITVENFRSILYTKNGVTLQIFLDADGTRIYLFNNKDAKLHIALSMDIWAKIYAELGR
jgi:hypothetical protein